MHIGAERAVNIKNLAIEVPQKVSKKGVDPLTFVDGSVWPKIASELSWVHGRRTFESRRAAFQSASFHPEIIGALNLRSTDFSAAVDAEIRPDTYFQDLELAKRLFPLLQIRVASSRKIEHLKEDFLRSQSGTLVPTTKLDEFAAYRRLFPGDTEIVQGHHFIFEGWNFFLDKERELTRLARIAADLRVIYPQRFREVRLYEDFWEDAQNGITAGGWESDYKRLVDFVFNARILAAEEVKLTQTGMELVFKQENASFRVEATLQLPTTRRF